MRKVIVVLFLAFGHIAIGQTANSKNLFADTSLYFIKQADSLNPVSLSPGELAGVGEIFEQAIKEFNVYQQRFADSVNPKKKRRMQSAVQLSSDNYFFRLAVMLNNQNQKVVRINGTCKRMFASGKRKNPIYDTDWKKKFISGSAVLDGGSCFMYVAINLTLKTHDRLGINGEG